MEMDMMQLDLFFEPPQKPRALLVHYGVVCPSEHRHVETIMRDVGSLKTAVSIQVAEHCGYWMWSTSIRSGDQYSGYRLGPKWGNFAETRSEAVQRGIDECRAKAASWPDAKKIMALLDSINAKTAGAH